MANIDINFLKFKYFYLYFFNHMINHEKTAGTTSVRQCVPTGKRV